MNIMIKQETTVPVVGPETIRDAIGFADLIEPTAHAFRESSLGRAENGLLILYPADSADAGDVYVKTGVLKGARTYIVKISPWFAANVEAGVHQGGFIAVFDSKTGHTLALLDDRHYLSAIRTAAAGALAARLLAPARIERAAVLGSGTQAFLQPQALYHERPFRELLVWARDVARAEVLRERLSMVLPDVDIRVEPDIETAVRACDVLLTCTQARDPLVRGAWLRPGQHVTAIGADDPSKCELAADALARASVFVDSLATTAANGCVARAISDGAYDAAQVAGEIGSLLNEESAWARSDESITIAKFVGLGAQDHQAAETTLARLGLIG
jgi:ornithine cyclodeaminase